MHFELEMGQSISSRVVVQVICRSTLHTSAQLGPKRQCDNAKDTPQLMHEVVEAS